MTTVQCWKMTSLNASLDSWLFACCERWDLLKKWWIASRDAMTNGHFAPFYTTRALIFFQFVVKTEKSHGLPWLFQAFRACHVDQDSNNRNSQLRSVFHVTKWWTYQENRNVFFLVCYSPGRAFKTWSSLFYNHIP